MQVNIFEAKTDFSKLIRLLESKREDCITVARNGKPVTKITLFQETPVSKRISAPCICTSLTQATFCQPIK